VPVELVINSIGKNHIHGYVSEPKYKGAELEAMAHSSANNPANSSPANNSPANNEATNTSGEQTDSTAKPSPARQKLEPPNN
jgi:hypothetical protein